MIAPLGALWERARGMARADRSRCVGPGPGQRLLVDGEPFFPLGLYYAGSDGASLKAAGFNSVHVVSRGVAHLDRRLRWCERWGLKAVVRPACGLAPRDDRARRHLEREIRVGRKSEALLAWEVEDEPLYNGINLSHLRDGVRLLRALDPKHPVLVVHWPGSLPWAHLLADVTDIGGVDLYPIPESRGYGGYRTKGLAQIAEALEDLRAQLGDKPRVAVLQAWNPDPLGLGPSGYPTPEQSLFMAESAIASGAAGIFYFGQRVLDEPNPALAAVSDTEAGWKAIQELNRDFWRSHDEVVREIGRLVKEPRCAE